MDNITSFFLIWLKRSTKIFISVNLNKIFCFSMSLNFIKAWRNNKYNKRVLIWHFTIVLNKINYGQIGDQTELFYTTNPVFYTSGNRFVHHTGTFGNLIFSLVQLGNRNTRSTCPKSVFAVICLISNLSIIYFD
jgi:hypothetical protein